MPTLPRCHLPQLIHAEKHPANDKSRFQRRKWRLLLLSQFNRVRLSATPWTAAYQAPPSLGFSRQECWSGCHCLLRMEAWGPQVACLACSW